MSTYENALTINYIDPSEIISQDLQAAIADHDPKDGPVETYKIIMTDCTLYEVAIFSDARRAGVCCNANADWFDASTVEEALEAWDRGIEGA
jgi:hypothetical protein